MYTITVTHEFCAAHTLTIAGAREPLHGHNFVTKATIAGDTLDGDGLLCDFHTAHAVLVEICNPFTNRNFNEIAPFDTTNPSAELIADDGGFGDEVVPVEWFLGASDSEGVGGAELVGDGDGVCGHGGD